MGAFTIRFPTLRKYGVRRRNKKVCSKMSRWRTALELKQRVIEEKLAQIRLFEIQVGSFWKYGASECCLADLTWPEDQHGRKLPSYGGQSGGVQAFPYTPHIGREDSIFKGNMEKNTVAQGPCMKASGADESAGGRSGGRIFGGAARRLGSSHVIGEAEKPSNRRIH